MASDESGKQAGGQDVFNVQKVRRLVAMMKEHDLAEIDLRQGDQRICLRRGGDPVTVAALPAAPAAAPPPQAPASAPPPASPAPAAEEPGVTINSPMVGTFYLSSNPESAPFVSVGDQVGPDTTVCIIEAMKVFNEVPAEASGKILAVLVENGSPVEFGQPLFRIQPS